MAIWFTVTIVTIIHEILTGFQRRKVVGKSLTGIDSTPCSEFKMAPNSLQLLPLRGGVYWICASLVTLTSRIWWSDIVWLYSWSLRDVLMLLLFPHRKQLPCENPPASLLQRLCAGKLRRPANSHTQLPDMWMRLFRTISPPANLPIDYKHVSIHPTMRSRETSHLHWELCPKYEPIEL